MKTTLMIPVTLLLTGLWNAAFAVAADHPAVTNTPDYLNPDLALPVRVNDLVSRMTRDEKIAQMYNDAPAIERLGVPSYDYWNEALHGVARAGYATVFPQAIGMAAMWDRQLLHNIASAISDEGRAKYNFFQSNDVRYRYTGLTFWSPNINLFRDPRWGRGQETYGEDPYLTGELGVEFIRGLQGDDPTYLKAAATAKHFAVHSGPEISRHSDNYDVSKKDLFETYLPAFKKAVVDANVEAVMCAYNAVDGVPACGSKMLLQDVLRGQFRFNGHVMSDCGAIADFYVPGAHNAAPSPAVAAAWAVRTGTDLNCGTGRFSTFANLNFALQKGLITDAEIDRAVARLFTTRFKLGMFDPKERVPYSTIPMSVVASVEHRLLSEKASEQSLVLLKNDGILPLSKNLRVAVIGPNADNQDVLVGNYNGIPTHPVTPLQGIKDYLGEQQVAYAPGSAIIDDIYGHASVLDESVLFHRTSAGALEKGLVGRYYAITPAPITDYTQLHPAPSLAATPSLTRTDKRLDFYFERSPVDNTVLGNFGVVWEGVLKPLSSGQYRFSSDASIYIDGRPTDGLVSLEAGHTYPIKINKLFVDDTLSNTSSIMRAPFAVRWLNTSVDLLAQSLAVAKKADVVLVMAGISPRIEGEEMPVKLAGFNYGDRTSLQLPDVQQQLIKALHKLNKPVVLVNFSGSAVALNWEHEHLNAIIQAFYPGEATGTALAKTLWGDVNPSGRLPVTFYHNLDGLGAFDDYNMANRTYRYFDGDVLYPFGYGLSYSDFTYHNLQVPASIKRGEDLNVKVTLTNDSDRDGAEVTQVYVSMPDAPVRVPRVALKGFSRTQLNGGQSTDVAITVPANELIYIDNNGLAQPYTGRLEVSIGAGQPAYTAANKMRQAVVLIK